MSETTEACKRFIGQFNDNRGWEKIPTPDQTLVSFVVYTGAYYITNMRLASCFFPAAEVTSWRLFWLLAPRFNGAPLTGSTTPGHYVDGGLTQWRNRCSWLANEGEDNRSENRSLLRMTYQTPEEFIKAFDYCFIDFLIESLPLLPQHRLNPKQAAEAATALVRRLRVG